jgi:uncharacterized membrane protein
VAIAVSLVPPLATVGICLELGRLDDAAGAMLLFVTNLSAIVVVACIVFILFGAAPSRDMLRDRVRLRNGFLVAILALVVVAIPLAWHAVDELQGVIRTSPVHRSCRPGSAIATYGSRRGRSMVTGS